MLQLMPRPGPSMTQGLQQAIKILALPGADLLARLTVEAASNPAITFSLPELPGWRRPLIDFDGHSAPPDSLIRQILTQIGLLRLDQHERAIAIALAERLEPTGWLSGSIDEVARVCGIETSEVEAVLSKLQQCEPSGIFARSLSECLRLQAAARGQLDDTVAATLEHLPLLGSGDMKALSHATGLDREQIERATRVIRGLDPKPGLAFGWAALPPMPPDLQIFRCGGTWKAQPHPAFMQVELTEGNDNGRAARMFVEAIRHRRDLAVRIGSILGQGQSRYLQGGPCLNALTARDVASLAQVHVSTVNRILGAITAETPRGTLQLRALICARAGKDSASVDQIKTRLTRMLEEAGTARPSDAELAERLALEGLTIARRTVQKYRIELTGAFKGAESNFFN